MGKSFASLKRQVTQTRKRSKERGGGEVGRLKREALYAHMRKPAEGDSDIAEPGNSSTKPEGGDESWQVSELEPDAQDAEPHADDKNGAGETRVSHEVREVDAEGKQAAFLAFMQEFRDNEADARRKTKVVVFVKEGKTAKALCTSLGTQRRMYKAGRKGFIKKKFSDTKGVAILVKFLKDDEQEQVVNFFRNGKVSTVVATDDCASDLWGQKDSVGMVVNYDMPVNMEQYEIRAGLAAHKDCLRVVTFLTPVRANRDIAPGLLAWLTKEGQPVPPGLTALAALHEKELEKNAKKAQAAAPSVGHHEPHKAKKA